MKDLSTLNLEGAVETFLADDVVVGGTYNYNAAVAKPEEIYIKKAFDVKLVSGGGDVNEGAVCCHVPVSYVCTYNCMSTRGS